MLYGLALNWQNLTGIHQRENRYNWGAHKQTKNHSRHFFYVEKKLAFFSA